MRFLIALTISLAAVPSLAFADDAPTDCSHDTACLSAMIHGPDVSSTNMLEQRGFTPGLMQAPANIGSVWLPKGTLFPVQTMQSYSSYGAANGGKIRYELVQDVFASGHLIAMKGDTAEGTVQNAMTGGGFFFIDVHGANLRVSVDKVYNFCGDTIAVDFDRSEFRKNRLGIAAGDVDVHVIRGQQYTAFADRPQHVCGSAMRGGVSAPPSDKALWTTTH